uniref:Uncharacterized protein n=1 Tax=Moniliophthora roreri TaxID=221103 RepID=A0A0W0F448_MONRR
MSIDPITLCTRCNHCIEPKSAHRPPPSHLLRSNYFPPKDELDDMAYDRLAFDVAIREAQIRYSTLQESGKECVLCNKCRVRLEANVDLDLAKREAERLSGLMDELSLARRKMTQCAEDYKPFMVPVRRLPPDLLEHIFYIHRDNDITLHMEQLSELASNYPLALRQSRLRRVWLPSPFSLAHTCCLWRDVVLSRPRLWDTIVLNIRHLPRAILLLLRLWLRLSRDTFLTVYITDHVALLPRWTDKDCHHNKIVQNVLALLLDHSHRWRRASLDVAWGCLDTAIRMHFPDLSAAGASSNFPNLESLDVDWLSRSGIGESTSINLSFLSIWQHSPRLRTLSLPEWFNEMELPFSQLSSITITRIPDSGTWILPMLRSCWNVEHVALIWSFFRRRDQSMNVFTDYTPDDDDDIFVLPRLSSFQIRFDTLRQWIAQLFYLVITPRLESIVDAEGSPIPTTDIIDVLSGIRFEGWPENAFLRFLSRTGPSFSSLRSLSLTAIVLSDTYLMKVFELTPNLTDLTLYEVLGQNNYPPIWSPQLLQRMDKGQSAPLLPKLGSLHVAVEASFHFFVVVQLGIAMVKSRVGSKSKLRTFTLRCRSELAKEIPDIVMARLHGIALEGRLVEYEDLAIYAPSVV